MNDPETTILHLQAALESARIDLRAAREELRETRGLLDSARKVNETEVYYRSRAQKDLEDASAEIDRLSRENVTLRNAIEELTSGSGRRRAASG